MRVRAKKRKKNHTTESLFGLLGNKSTNKRKKFNDSRSIVHVGYIVPEGVDGTENVDVIATKIDIFDNSMNRVILPVNATMGFNFVEILQTLCQTSHEVRESLDVND